MAWVLVPQLFPTFCDTMECSQSGCSVHGISQARILEWVPISFSRGSSQPRDWTLISCIAGRLSTIWATREVLMNSLIWVIFFKKRGSTLEEDSQFYWVVSSCIDFGQVLVDTRSHSHTAPLPRLIHFSLSFLGRNHGMGKEGGFLSWFPVRAVSLPPTGPKGRHGFWDVLVSASRCNKLPQTLWLKITRIYSLTVGCQKS